MSEPIMVGVLDAIQSMRTNFEDVIKPRVNQLSERYNAIDAEANELTEAGVDDAFSRYTLQDVYDKYVRGRSVAVPHFVASVPRSLCACAPTSTRR